MSNKNHPQIGPLFEDWLREEGIHEAVDATAMARVRAWQQEEAAKAAEKPASRDAEN